MWESAQQFFRGPVWMVASAASAVLTGLGIYQALRGHSLWPWLFVAALALTFASFISFHRERVKSATGTEELKAKIGQLVDRGLVLYDELNTGPEPTETDEEGRGIAFSFFPPDSKWDRAFAYDHEARQLLREYDSGLLFVYADAVNEAQRKRRRRERQLDNVQQKLPGPEQMKQMIERLHRRPAEQLECFANALADVKRQLLGCARSAPDYAHVWGMPTKRPGARRISAGSA